MFRLHSVKDNDTREIIIDERLLIVAAKCNNPTHLQPPCKLSEHSIFWKTDTLWKWNQNLWLFYHAYTHFDRSTKPLLRVSSL